MLEVGWLNIGFIILGLLEFIYLWWVSAKNKWLLRIVPVWLLVQATLADQGFYQDTETFPPRFIFVFLPVFIAVLFLGLTKHAQKFRSSFDLEALHYIHLVRIPVEVFFLYGLYRYGYVAKELTFHGNNWDIISGVTMPLLAFAYWRVKIVSKKLLIYWNIICFLILIWTISQAILTVPSPFQQLAQKQPTIAVLYFPFIWLPAFVAPTVLLSHLIAIKRLKE